MFVARRLIAPGFVTLRDLVFRGAAPFDHVAMVLRTAEGYRTVECTGQGIGCWVLQERLDDYIIKGVVIRRLQANLTNEMVDALNKFLQSVKHKPYRLNQNILSRMARTCLCCQRVGQNSRGGPGVSVAKKYAADGANAEERKELDDADDEEEVIEDGQVPLPQLLPPRPHGGAGAGQPQGLYPPSADIDQPASPSVQLHLSASASPTAPSSTSVSSASSAESSARSAYASTASATAASAASAAAARRAAQRATLYSPKSQLELKEHERIQRHYPKAERIEDLHTRKGFFCSSFIAACYMKMGLLPAWPPIDWYLPNTFSSRTAIQAPLLMGAEWGEETLVEKPSADTNPRKWTRLQKQAMEDQRRAKAEQEERRKAAAAAAVASATAAPAASSSSSSPAPKRSGGHTLQLPGSHPAGVASSSSHSLEPPVSSRGFSSNASSLGVSIHLVSSARSSPQLRPLASTDIDDAPPMAQRGHHHAFMRVNASIGPMSGNASAGTSQAIAAANAAALDSHRSRRHSLSSSLQQREESTVQPAAASGAAGVNATSKPSISRTTTPDKPFTTPAAATGPAATATVLGPQPRRDRSASSSRRRSIQSFESSPPPDGATTGPTATTAGAAPSSPSSSPSPSPSPVHAPLSVATQQSPTSNKGARFPSSPIANAAAAAAGRPPLTPIPASPSQAPSGDADAGEGEASPLRHAQPVASPSMQMQQMQQSESPSAAPLPPTDASSPLHSSPPSHRRVPSTVRLPPLSRAPSKRAVHEE